jgi:putative PIN family toxin of toxin-antitoxin system
LKIVIDTNIVFSAILNTSSKIANLIIHNHNYFEFFAPDFLRTELKNHFQKLKVTTKLPDDDIHFLIEYFASKIKFIPDTEISLALKEKAFELVKGFDENDTPFVALAIHLDAVLWTGDKKLINGLNNNNFLNFISTNGISLLLEDLQNR